MNTKSSQIKSKHNKIILFLFLAVLIGPFLFAYVLVQKSQNHQFRTSNHGDLITPVRSVAKTTFYDLEKKQKFSAEKLAGKWWLVYVSPPKCQQTCHDVLYNMRQIRTALGKDSPRLERLFIAHPDCHLSVCETYLSESYPDMHRAQIKPRDFDILFGNISNFSERESIGEIFIIDPKGNIMMHYSADMEAKAILSDMKRLLKISKIG